MNLDMNVAILLMDFGASYEFYRDGKANRWSPMMSASSDGNLQMVQILHKLGADVNETDDSMYTPMIAAAENGRRDVVMYLIEQGADHTRLTHCARTAFDAARGEGFHDLVRDMEAAIKILESRTVVRENKRSFEHI